MIVIPPQRAAVAPEEGGAIISDGPCGQIAKDSTVDIIHIIDLYGAEHYRDAA